jgi:hypothetical protein
MWNYLHQLRESYAAALISAPTRTRTVRATSHPTNSGHCPVWPHRIHRWSHRPAYGTPNPNSAISVCPAPACLNPAGCQCRAYGRVCITGQANLSSKHLSLQFCVPSCWPSQRYPGPACARIPRAAPQALDVPVRMDRGCRHSSRSYTPRAGQCAGTPTEQQRHARDR